MNKYFDAAADSYSRGRPTYPAELYYWISKQVSQTDLVWDCACGSGQASIDLAAYFNRVEASDISDVQISAATPHKKVHYQVCPSESTQYPDNYFDVVCVAHALHWLDLDVFWSEVKRVLKPDGLFVCWSYNWPYLNSEADSVLQALIKEKLQPYWPKESESLRNSYRDIEFPLEMIDVPTFELVQSWTAYRVFDYIRSWTAASLLMQKEGDGFIENAWNNLMEHWPDPLEKRRVTFPFFVKAGRFKDE